MKHEKFEEDLARGMVAEDFVLKLLRRGFPCATKVDAFPGYDIWVPELHEGFEVKADLMSNETGNYFIEVEFGGKPSGLETTTAGYWTIWDSFRVALMTPFQLKQLIKKLQLEKKDFGANDATKERKAYLVPKEEILGKFQIIWEKN